MTKEEVYNALCEDRILKSRTSNAGGENRLEVFHSNWGYVEVVDKEYSSNYCMASETKKMKFRKFWDKYSKYDWNIE